MIEDEEAPQPLVAKVREKVPMRVGAAVAVVLGIALLAWIIFGTSGSGKDKTPGAAPAATNASGGGGSGPVALSLDGLKTLLASLHQPVYWVGPKDGTSYEFRQLANGIVYLRYLPSGTKAGDSSTFLTVGTYPMANAFAASQQMVKSGSVKVIPTGSSVVAYSPTKSDTDAYEVFSGANYQVEVYSPTPGVARNLVAQGMVAPVPGGASSGLSATATSEQKLTELAKSLGQPIYWASNEPGTTLEVRETTAGYVYVRYLPKGVAVGDPRVYRSIGTYPVANAFAVTEALGKKAGYATTKLSGGGIAVYPKAGTNAYIAFPGSNYQVEVFDPKPGAARDLAAAGKIAALK